MGSRGRSIRLRIYFLVAIPLVTMLAVFSYTGYHSVQNYRNVKRAPQLILSTAEQSAYFFLNVINERRAAVVYLSAPNKNNLAAYEASVTATKGKLDAFRTQMMSPTVTSAEDSAETTAISKALGALGNMTELRDGVAAKKITPFRAWEGYTQVMEDQPAIFEAEASSFSNATSAEQGFGLIQVVLIREDIAEMDSLLAGGLAGGNMSVDERAAFSQAYGRMQDQLNTFPALLNKTEQNAYYKDIHTPRMRQEYNEITKISDAVAGGVPLQQIEATGVNSQNWATIANDWGAASFQGGVDAAAQALKVDQGIASNARNQLILAASLGLAALLFTLIVTTLLAGAVNRRLTVLRRGALSLATDHLPSVVTRLRRGENVDIAAEAPPLRFGKDEIGQVGQAIDLVRQTALRSAVEESRLRTGINDMFRNLARRNQSLLQRQLTMLDGMERRATDPDVLDDLFKMDHLTTRMRRHAEGLIILSGAAPGRGWSTPVKLIDVMRGAVAEVEDFARVIVTTQSKAALTGSAVTDLIHLLAELIENATTLSPPFTQVRVHGEMVANGFAIDIEDRGLGMTQARMNELNERLANPPEINPASTEQLGLFVVGQLARRHGVSVSLRTSAYGGVTAIVMIPQRLVVDDSTPAIAPGPQPSAAEQVPAGATSAFGGSNGFGGPNGVGGSNGVGGPPDLDNIPISSPPFGTPNPFGTNGVGGPVPSSGAPRPPGEPVIKGTAVTRPTPRPAPGDLPRLHSDGEPPRPEPGETAAPQPASSYSSSSFYGSPVAEDTAPAGYDGAASYDPTAAAGYDTGGSGFYSEAGTPPDAPGPGAYGPGDGYRPEAEDSSPDDADSFKGLPRRVRQASLAPQLRTSPGGGPRVPQASAPDPVDVKNTLSAMQRGWQQGRAQSQRDTGGHQ